MKKSTFLRSLLAVLFVAVGAIGYAQTWELVTDASALAVNDQVVIVAKKHNFALSTTQNGNNRGPEAITKENNCVIINDKVQILTIELGKKDGTFAFYTGAGYLYAASSSKNYLKTQTTLSNDGSWSVTIDGTGIATIKSQGTNTRNWLRYNSSSKLFSCYSTGQEDVAIYRLNQTIEAPDTPENPVIEPNGGEFEGSQEVTIVADDEVWYTLTGDDPTEDVHTVYTAPFTITETTTVKAMAVNEQGNYSAVVTAEFTKKAEDIVEENYKWTLVKDNGTLKVGDEIVIVAKEESYALSTNQKTNNRGAVGITKDGDVVSINDEVQVLTLHAGTIDGKYAFYTGNGYLYAASSSNNHLKTEASLSDNSSWNISVTTEGEATIIAQGTNTRNVMQYNPNPNNGSPLFACYASASQKPVSIYKKSFEANILSDKCYYIYMGDVWGETEGGCWYVAHFTNKNTGTYTWVRGFNEGLEANTYCFYLSQYNVPTRATEEPVYTHVEFIQVPASVAIPENISTLDLSGVVYKTSGVKYYDGKSSTTYNLTTDEWQAVGTSVERVEWGADIDYTNGEVHADGAIEVYSTGGVLVARGQDCVVLRDLNRGVYIVRCGDKVRKVVR